MEYSNNQYGEVFADVYDDWYHDLDPVVEVVEFVRQFAEHTSVLELGVGTGRLAVPLAQSGLRVVGIDSSPAMLAALSAKPDGRLVETLLGHMVADMPDEQFGVVLLAYNTLFNLLTEPEQLECLVQSAKRLLPGAHVIVDCFVPSDHLPQTVAPHVVRTVGATSVFSEATIDQANQIMRGAFSESVGNGPDRTWVVRYATVEQIDAMANRAGLQVEQRWSSYAREPFSDNSVRHITVYGKAPDRPR